MLQRTLALVETDIVTQLLFDHVHEVHLSMLMEMLDIRAASKVFVMNVMVPKRTEHLYGRIKKKSGKRKVDGWAPYTMDNSPIIIFRNEGESYRLSSDFTSKRHFISRKR